MMWNRLVPVVGYVVLVYWLGVSGFIAWDGYRATWPVVDFWLKMLAPLVLLLNVSGVILALLVLPATPGRWKALALHGIPLLAVLAFLWWLFFGVKI